MPGTLPILKISNACRVSGIVDSTRRMPPRFSSLRASSTVSAIPDSQSCHRVMSLELIRTDAGSRDSTAFINSASFP